MISRTVRIKTVGGFDGIDRLVDFRLQVRPFGIIDEILRGTKILRGNMVIAKRYRLGNSLIYVTTYITITIVQCEDNDLGAAILSPFALQQSGEATIHDKDLSIRVLVAQVGSSRVNSSRDPFAAMQTRLFTSDCSIGSFFFFFYR